MYSLRHQSMWNEREGKIKMESAEREAEVLRATLARKEEIISVSEKKVRDQIFFFFFLNIFFKIVFLNIFFKYFFKIFFLNIFLKYFFKIFF